MKARRFDLARFGDELDVIRASRGMTWYEVAMETGVHPSTVSRIYNDKHTPSVHAVAALCEWARLYDLRPFIIGAGEKEEALTDGADPGPRAIHATQ